MAKGNVPYFLSVLKIKVYTLSWSISYFYGGVLNYQDQKQLEEERIYFS